MKNNNTYLVLGSSKSIGQQLVKKLILDNNNFVIGVSRNSSNIKKKNYLEINCNLLKYDSFKMIINKLNKKKIYKINNILISLRDRSGKKDNLENEFKILIFNPLKFIKHLSKLNYFDQNNFNSVIYIGSALDSSLSKYANINYLLPRQILKYLIEDLAKQYKSYRLRFFCLEPFLFIKEQNKNILNSKNEIVHTINEKSNYKLINVNEICDLILFLFSKKSNLLNGQTLRIDGNVLKSI